MATRRRPSSVPRKPSLSPTRISAYLECALKYRYLYIDKIGRFYLRSRPGYSFGSTLHRVLQEFHAEGGVQSAEQMAEQLDLRWVGAGYDSAEQEEAFRSAAAEVVQLYHAASADRAADQVTTLFTEKTIKTDMGPFVLTGRVDRIDQHSDGTMEVIDYKSGRMEVTSEDVADSLAMNIYQYILRQTYPGTRVIATIYALRSGLHASAEMSDEDAERFGKDMLALGEEILSREYVSLKPERIGACEYCEFLPRCQRYWRSRGGEATDRGGVSSSGGTEG
jgi:putative RecB family exonuclease